MTSTKVDSPRYMQRRNRTTINDVAQSLGLSKGTISRAMNGYSDIAMSTRLRVQLRAKDLGYRPLSHAQAIRTGLAKSLGLVLQVNEHDSHRPFLAGFLAGITKSSTAMGWTLTVATAESESDMLDTLSRLVEERKVDGFILPRTLADDSRINFLRSEDIPFVLYGRTANPDGCAWYDIEGECAMENAVIRLSKFGHERIAFVNGGERYNYSILRHQGYLNGLAQTGVQFDNTIIRSGAVTLEQGYTAALELLALPNPPTAYVYAVDIAALGFYKAADQLGLRVGIDVSLIAYDGVLEGAFATPPLTTFSVDRNRAGQRLAQLLVMRIRGTDPELLRETESAQLIVRQSDGPLTQTSRELAEYLKDTAMRNSLEKEYR